MTPNSLRCSRLRPVTKLLLLHVPRVGRSGSAWAVRPLVIPLTDVHEAMKLVDSYDGEPEDFLLPLSEALLDPVGIYMALVTDRVLARGWEPNGFEQCSGYRVYRYKRME